MKVGDLVRLSLRKTRKGRPYEDMIGVVTQVYPADAVGFVFVKAVFDMEHTFNINDLEVVSEKSFTLDNSYLCLRHEDR